MIKYHPLQNVFFNRFAGNWNDRFEVDYHGVLNKIALDKIIANEPTREITVWPGMDYQWPGGWQLPISPNLKLLGPDQRARIKIPETKDGSEFIIVSKQGNHGFNTDSYHFNYRYQVIDEININNQSILSIFKLIPNSKLPAISSGDQIKFSKYQRGLHYLNGDYQDPEDWGVWSSGKKMLLDFPLSKNAPSSLEMNFRALVNDKLSRQRIEIYIDGEFYKIEEVLNGFNNKLIIPIPHNKSRLMIEIKLPDAAKPIDLNINKDAREIAIGLQSIQFK
jgi:hypothetical protein